MRILMVLIPDEAGAADGTLTMGRLAGPYYQFVEAKMDVVFASPDGGAPQVFATDLSHDPDAERFKADRAARDALSDTLTFSEIHPDDFDGAYCAGALGEIWLGSANPAAIVRDFLKRGKPVVLTPGVVGLQPYGSADGVLILADGKSSPCRAARALVGLLSAEHGDLVQDL